MIAPVQRDSQSECALIYGLFLCNDHIFAACSWKNQTLPDGYRWKENGVDFFCSSNQRVRPGCYLYTDKINCTGAFRGLFICSAQLPWLHLYKGAKTTQDLELPFPFSVLAWAPINLLTSGYWFNKKVCASEI